MMTTPREAPDLDKILREFRQGCFAVRDALYQKGEDKTEIMKQKQEKAKAAIYQHIVEQVEASLNNIKAPINLEGAQ